VPDSTRYRYIDFVGGRILEQREVLALQNISEGLDSAGNVLVQDLNALYREGATLNVSPVISAGTTTVTLSPIDNTKPMQVFVHGRWETLRSGDAPPVTLTSGQTKLYLNWALNIITSAQDPSLVDASTGEPTANMGELDFAVSAVDTSAVAPTITQIAVNTAPIIVFSFTPSGNTLIVAPIDNVNAPAYGTGTSAGLVKLSTNTAAGVAAATNDPRLTDSRAPAVGSVVDASVRVPVSNGARNSDGSNQYDLTTDPGGISADKIIFQIYKERLSDFLANLLAQVSSVVTSLAGHIGAGLGQANTHPFPSYSQVGAAPISHVNLPLGAVGSHPPQVNSDTGGFLVLQQTGNSPGAPAYQVTQAPGTQVCSIQHNGDFASIFLNSLVFNPGGGPITFSGALGTLYQLGQVVRDHVNQNNNANPHGMTAATIGAVTAAAFTRVSNANGSYRIWPDGTIECWGSVVAGATGNQFSSANITFPHGFSTLPYVQLSVVGLPSPSAHAQDLAQVQMSGLNTGGASLALQCSVPTGGGGGNFNNSVTVQFYAIGF
jgi:hypothetical protein